jgi:Spy/CpxP family protein refolding chaperone
MTRFLYAVAAVVLIAAGAVGIARADFSTGRGWGVHGAGRFPLAYFAHELNLTDAQKTQIKSLWNEERPAVTPLLRQLVTECSEMPAADQSGSFDESKARAAAEKQAATISQLLVERQRLISRIYNEVLTPEQRTKADQLRERMHGRIEGFLNHLDQSTD